MAFLNLESALQQKLQFQQESEEKQSWERELDRNASRWADHVFTYTMEDGEEIVIHEDHDQLGHRVHLFFLMSFLFLC